MAKPTEAQVAAGTIKSDGSLTADGVRVRPKVWGVCATCERRIYFIKVGENCVYHSVNAS